jgi:hypothetical protein
VLECLLGRGLLETCFSWSLNRAFDCEFATLKTSKEEMHLALKNLIEDRRRFIIATAGIVFATFLMTFQVFLLRSFLTSASRIVDASDADLWVTARGVTCFDFSAVIDRRFVSIVQGTSGVQGVPNIESQMGTTKP